MTVNKVDLSIDPSVILGIVDHHFLNQQNRISSCTNQASYIGNDYSRSELSRKNCTRGSERVLLWMQSLKRVELVPEHILATHSAWILCLNIDHGILLQFGSYGLMVDGTIRNASYGLWADRGSEARAINKDELQSISFYTMRGFKIVAIFYALLNSDNSKRLF